MPRTEAQLKYWLKNRKILNEKSKIYNRKNKEKFKKLTQKRRKENPDVYADIRLRSVYGITLEQYNKILKKQNYVCKICHKTTKDISCKPSRNDKRLHVDHNHATGKIRGLLCRRCNCVLGFVKDNVYLLKQTIKYLNKYERL